MLIRCCVERLLHYNLFNSEILIAFSTIYC